MITVQVSFDTAQADALVTYAIRSGYMRTEPRKPWTARERKEAVRWALDRFAATLNPRTE